MQVSVLWLPKEVKSLFYRSVLHFPTGLEQKTAAPVTGTVPGNYKKPVYSKCDKNARYSHKKKDT